MEIRYPGCSNKIPYFSVREAERIQRLIKKRKGEHKKIYICQKNPTLSKHWHLTTIGKTKRNKESK